MEIVGKTKNGFLLSATENEIANLFGEYSRYFLDKEIKIEPGLKIDVWAAYQKLSWLAKRQEYFERLKKDLRGAADNIEAGEYFLNRYLDGE